MDERQIGTVIIDAAVSIHQELGPGLLESVYEIVLADELERRGLPVRRQVAIPLNFRGRKFKEAFKADLIVGQKVIVELKCVETLTNAHKKQVLTYLKLTRLKLGYLLNFSTALMKDGIIRTVNHL